jgi:hypothetical protein
LPRFAQAETLPSNPSRFSFPSEEAPVESCDPPKIEGGTAVKETTVSAAEVETPSMELRPRVQEALGELVGAAN